MRNDSLAIRSYHNIPLKLDLSQQVVVMDTLRELLHVLEVFFLQLNPFLEQQYKALERHTVTNTCTHTQVLDKLAVKVLTCLEGRSSK